MSTPITAKKSPIKIAFLFAFFVFASSVNANLKNEEGLSEPSRFYYLNIFEGYFPIPTRYGVAVPKSKSDIPFILELNSPVLNFTALSPEHKRKAVMSGTGYIRAGNFYPGVDENRLTGDLVLLEELKIYGLKVKSFGLPEKDFVEKLIISSVLISDGVSYLLISDEDVSLWAELLEHYGQFNRIEK